MTVVELIEELERRAALIPPKRDSSGKFDGIPLSSTLCSHLKNVKDSFKAKAPLNSSERSSWKYVSTVGRMCGLFDNLPYSPELKKELLEALNR